MLTINVLKRIDIFKDLSEEKYKKLLSPLVRLLFAGLPAFALR